jgi:hypothetical protein
MQLRCQLQTTASPEQVLDAYTDFSDRRLHTWRDTLKPGNYALLEQGPTWAVVREGSLRMGVVLRYDWSEPATVRWSIVESSFCDHGDGRLTTRAAAGGGAHVEILIDEHGGRGVSGRVVLGLKGLLGPRVLRRCSKRTLDRLSTEARAAAS